MYWPLSCRPPVELTQSGRAPPPAFGVGLFGAFADALAGGFGAGLAGFATLLRGEFRPLLLRGSPATVFAVGLLAGGGLANGAAGVCANDGWVTIGASASTGGT